MYIIQYVYALPPRSTLAHTCTVHVYIHVGTVYM